MSTAAGQAVESGAHFDLIVVGLGAMGSAALYHAATRGLRVLGIDRFDPPHSFGSSHAESRITRLAVGEGPQYLPFVARSHEIWRDLEALTGRKLFHQSGGYIITPATPTQDHRWGGFVHRTADIASAANIDFEIRSPDQVRAHIPQIKLQGDEAIGFEPTAGIVMCEQAVATQLELAHKAGATSLVNTTVTAVEPDGAGARVETADARYQADRVLVATGAWFAALAPPVDAAAVAVTRQAVFWFQVERPQDFSVDRFPFIMWPGQTIADYSAAFPIAPGARSALKLMGEQFHETTSAEAVDRVVRPEEAHDLYERLVRTRLDGVTPTVVDSAVCLYTSTRTEDFLIDYHLESEHILFASPCSGHGFKHSTALGEAMVGKLFDVADVQDLSPFMRQ